MPLKGVIATVSVIAISAAVTAIALHFLVTGNEDDDGKSITKNGITLTLRRLRETKIGVELEFLVSGLQMHQTPGTPVDILSDHVKYNGRPPQGTRVSITRQDEGTFRLLINFYTAAGEYGKLTIERIYVLFSAIESGGENRYVEGPWSFRLRARETYP